MPSPTTPSRTALEDGSEPLAVFAPALDQPFLETLAAAVLNGALVAPSWRSPSQPSHRSLAIYVPYREAARQLRSAFLKASGDTATLVPRIFVLGEADPVETFAYHAPYLTNIEAANEALANALALPPPLSALQRDLDLAGVVHEAQSGLVAIEEAETLYAGLSPAAAFSAASEIASVLSECQREGVGYDALLQYLSRYRVATGQRQLSRQLFRETITAWQARAGRAGVVDAEAYRQHLTAFSQRMLDLSSAPVVVAGSTGSIPHTRAFMYAVARHRKGAVVLPGLDRFLDDAAFAAAAADPAHSQHALAGLLADWGLGRDGVRNLPALAGGALRWPEARARFLSAALQPAGGALVPKQPASDPDIALIEAHTLQEEAEVVAAIMRETLEREGATAATITPDRNLLARIGGVLASYGLMSEAQETGDAAALLAIEAAVSDAPQAVAALMRAAAGARRDAWHRAARMLDTTILRQMWCPRAGEALADAFRHARQNGLAHPAFQNTHDAVEDAEHLATQLLEALQPLKAQERAKRSLKEWQERWQVVLTALHRLGLAANETTPFASWDPSEDVRLKLTLQEFASLAKTVANGSRDHGGFDDLHPRLTLATPLDARLASADVVVLAGLNEGCWPKRPDPGPWLSASDRAALGLPPVEQTVGQAAHDFQLVASGARRLILTRALKIDGTATRPSRFIARIKALAQTLPADALTPKTPWMEIGAQLRRPAPAPQALKPAPTPPVAVRPRRLSVTALETLAANPYAIYARYILKLLPFPASGSDISGRARGILFHAALQQLNERWRGRWFEQGPEAAADALSDAARRAGFDMANAPLWRPRFARFASWLAGFEAERASSLEDVRGELAAQHTLSLPEGPFEMTARADRVELRHDGTAAVLDYKTSRTSIDMSSRRNAPQLALEGFLVREGAFRGLGARPVSELAYVSVTGAEPPGAYCPLKGNTADIIDSAVTGIVSLLKRFDDAATPYAYEAHSAFQDKAQYDPYAHLARVGEWAVIGGEADDDG
jgi:ATP-dependent helicase/nuclease subunit B